VAASVEGLTHADGSVPVTGSSNNGGGSGTSWVLMPFSQQERREKELTQMMDLKRQVASVLFGATRQAVTFTSSSSLAAPAIIESTAPLASLATNETLDSWYY
jgi:hypothetical protein